MRIVIGLIIFILCGCQPEIKQTPFIEKVKQTDISFLKHKKRLKIAIIDTGLDLQDPRFKDVLCENGHKDFTGEGIQDENGHGTHIAGLIKEYAKNTNYCLIIYKYYSKKDQGGYKDLQAEINSLIDSRKQKVDIINLSVNGYEFSKKEYEAIKSLKKTLVVTAAGNSNTDIDKYKRYPASCGTKNLIVVGNKMQNGQLSESSNYSLNMVTEIGVNVRSTLPNGKYGYMSGTSQATAIHTGKLIFTILTNREN